MKFSLKENKIRSFQKLLVDGNALLIELLKYFNL